MDDLEPLRADHAEALLAFEVANRAYFAASVSDRGEDYFHYFRERLEARLSEQSDGTGAYYLLIADDGSVIGRFNLIFIGEGTANLGYRVAESVAGRGVATAAVRDICRVAANDHGVHTIRAATSHANVASQKVLTKAGFAAVGPADPQEIGGKLGNWYARHLTE